MSLAAQLAPLVRRYATEVAEDATRTLVREVKKAAPVYKADARDPRPRAGGRLRDSISAEPVRSRGSEVSTTIKAEAEHASFQDQGTKGPYTILPRRPGGLLVFFWPRVGRVVALRRVRHPGIQNPSRFWTKTVNAKGWLEALRSAAAGTSVRG